MAGTDAFVLVPQTPAIADALAKRVDNDAVDYGGGDIRHRQRNRTAGAAALELQDVRNAAPGPTDHGAVVRTPEPSAAAIAQVPQNASTGVLLAANALRRGIVIHNAPTSTDVLLVAFAATAAAGAYTHRLLPGETWDRRGGYTGVISGIWASAGSGHAAVTEEQ